MNILKLTTLLIALSLQAFAQFSQNKNLCSVFNEMPFAEVNNGGMGSNGFDSPLGPFNPQCFANEKQFQVSVGMLSSVGGTGDNLLKKNESYDMVTPGTRLYNNNRDFLPEIAVKYHNKYGSVQLNLFYTLSGNFTKSNRWWTTAFAIEPANDPYYNTGHGHLTGDVLESLSPQFITRNTVLQLSVSGYIGENVSVTGGFYTNRYLEQINAGDPQFTVTKLYTNYFDNVQFLLGVNYRNRNGFALYLLGHSQSSKTPLRPDDLAPFGADTPPNKGVVNFPGMVAYGFQFNPLGYLKASVEMTHTFLVSDNMKRDYYILDGQLSSTYANYTFEHSVHNYEAAFGLQFTPDDHFSFGIQYSRYLKYDNEAYNDLPHYFNNYYAELLRGSPTAFDLGTPKNFYTVNVTAGFSYAYYTLGVYYQYRSLEYSFNDYNVESYSTQFVKVALSLGI